MYFIPAVRFQENLLKTMIQIENTFFELGRSCKRNCLIICDRGAMDASACKFSPFFCFMVHFIICLLKVITKEKWEQIMKNNHWNNVELRDNRYNQIIHMVSAAKGAEEFYSTEVSPISVKFFSCRKTAKIGFYYSCFSGS